MLKKVALRMANLVGETGCYRLFCREAVPVFMLHRVYAEKETIAGGISVEVLRDFLNYLASHDYRVVTVEELFVMLSEGGNIDPKSVMFTIDDGFSDQYELAAKVFEEFGYSLNFFLISGFLDGILWPWDVQITHALVHSKLERVELQLPSTEPHLVALAQDGPKIAARKLRDALKTCPQSDLYDWIRTDLYNSLGVAFPDEVPSDFTAMTWDHARSLKDSGHGVYPHTCTHRILSTLNDEERRSEISESQNRVELEMGSRPLVFAYPTGRSTDYGGADVDHLRNRGFEMAFTTVPGYVQRGQNLLKLPRFALPANLADFQQIVNRFEALKTRVRARCA